LSPHDKKQKTALMHIIGCGTPTPTPERFGSCLILDLDGQRLMFDCGPGSTYKMVRMGLPPTSISHLFLPIITTTTTSIIPVFCSAAGITKEKEFPG
jgi:hypothetical protein